MSSVAPERYYTFIRSAKNFEDLAKARKKTVDRNLSIEEARRACAAFNSNRTALQEKNGTKMEFTRQ